MSFALLFPSPGGSISNYSLQAFLLCQCINLLWQISSQPCRGFVPLILNVLFSLYSVQCILISFEIPPWPMDSLQCVVPCPGVQRASYFLPVTDFQFDSNMAKEHTLDGADSFLIFWSLFHGLGCGTLRSLGPEVTASLPSFLYPSVFWQFL